MPPLQQAAIALVPLRGVRGKAAPKRLAQIKKFKFRQSAYRRCSIPKKVVILLNVYSYQSLKAGCYAQHLK